MAEAPLTFEELVDVHGRLQQSSPFFKGMDLPSFSRFMREQTGTDLFDQGLEDSRIKRASLAIDRFLEPAAEPTGRAFASVGKAIGLGDYEETLTEVGESIPRAFGETLPIIAGSALLMAPEPTGLTKLAGAGLVGAGAASAGAKTYTETGSSLAGLISGGAMAALPGAASVGRKLIAKPLINKFLTTPVAEKIGEAGGQVITRVPRFTEKASGRVVSEVAKLAETGLESLGANLGVTALNEAAGQAVSLAAGEGLYNPLTVEHAIELAAGNIPFAAIDAAVHVQGRMTKGFASQTMRENAAYLGQVAEAQQLADIADQINRFRITEMRTQKPRQLGWPEGPEAPGGVGPRQKFADTGDLPPGFPGEAKVPPPTAVTGLDARAKVSDTITRANVILKDVGDLVERGILTPDEAAARIKRIQAAAAAPPPPEVKPAPTKIAGDNMPPHLKVTTESQYPEAAQLGAREFFQQYFSNHGLSQQEVESFTLIAEKIATAFSDIGKTRIAELLDEKGSVSGMFFPRSTQVENAFVGLVPYSPGKSNDLRAARWQNLKTLGHELWHGIELAAGNDRLDPVKLAMYNTIAKTAMALTPQERMDILAHTWDMMIPKEVRDETMTETLTHRAAVGANDWKEFMADLAGSFTLGMVSPDAASRVRYIKEEMRFAPPLLQQFARMLYTPMRDIIKSVVDYQAAHKMSQGPFAYVKDIPVKHFKTIISNVESILQDVNRIDELVKRLADIEKNDPAYFEQLRLNALVLPQAPVSRARLSFVRDNKKDAQMEPHLESIIDAASKALGLTKHAEMEKELGVQPNFLKRWFFPFAQLSADYPQLLSIHNIVRSYSALANDHLVDMLSPFLSKPSKFGHVTIDDAAHGLAKVAASKKETDALNQVRLISNEVSKNEKRRLTDDEVRDALPRNLSTEEQARVVDLFRTLTDDVYPKAADIQVHAAGLKVAHAAAALLMGKNKSLKWKDALAYGTGIRDVLMAQNDPLQAPMVQQKVAFLQQMVGPQAFQSASELASVMLQQVKRLDEMFRNNPGYSPETRLGQYLVLWKRDKEWGSFASDDFNQAKAKLDKIRSEGVKVAFMRDKTDHRQTFAGMDPDLVERWTAIDKAAFDAALKQLGESTEEIEAFREMYSPGDAVAREIKSRGLQQFLLPRRLAEGREDTNPVLGFLNYVSGVAHGVAKGFVREQAGLAFMDPELTKNPKLKDLAKKHFNNVINPSAPEMRALKQLNFAYFLGFNVSSMLIEGSQGVLTLVPQLTRDTGSIAQGYKAWGSAVRQVVDGFLSKDRKLADKDTQAALDRAVKEGRVDAGIMQEFNTLEDNLIPNLRALASGDSKIVAAGEIVKKPVYWYLHAARWLYSWAPRANSHVAFVAAFDTARQRLKMSNEQAYDYAITTVDRTMFGGGKAGRPVELFANTGKLQGVVGLMYSLQTYTFSTISMMARMGSDSIARSDRLTKEQKSAARKAFGQMLVTQVALGGALSLPMTSGLLAVIDQFFPELEVQKNARELVQGMLGENDGGTQMLTDIALKGLPDAAGLDLSSRVGLSSLLGVNPYSGFQIGNLVGPIGGVFENLAKGIRNVAVGDMKQAARTLLPTPYRNVLQLAQDHGQLKDRSGRLLYEPGEIEKLLLSVGFRPSSVTRRQEAAQLVAKTEEVERARLGRFHKEQSELLLQGKPGEVRENLLNYARENALYDARVGARRVVELAQQATVPYDVARSGARTSSATRSDIASMYGLRPPATEQQLLLQRKSLERSLQIPGAGVLTKSEMVLARTVDYLMSLSPGLSYQEARSQAERLLGRGLGPRL